ncbi:AbrB/MazE/SpoVT family DNA-binding domain-containing protein [Abyssibacter sp.]|uniref:AbrB/MazE/SpoVT family DNA-binding domain-containing protein n=1 Tax=Abyssibacter sp. TaxID=2320200 RepID=UPI0035142877
MEATTLSSKYQLVIPRAIRERMNLQPGQKFQTLQIGNRIELLPLESPQQARGFLKGIQTNVPREPDRA